jgi:hypothetical protein
MYIDKSSEDEVDFLKIATSEVDRPLSKIPYDFVFRGSRNFTSIY